jgi:hypothetical protein
VFFRLTGHFFVQQFQRVRNRTCKKKAATVPPARRDDNPQSDMKNLRKQRKDSSRNRLTPEQQAKTEHWLLIENLGYAEVRERIKAEFGVEMSVPGIGRLYGYFAKMRQVRELVEAHVRENRLDEKPASEDELRATALTLVSNAIMHNSCERPGQLEEVLPYAKLMVESERNEVLRRRTALAERSFERMALKDMDLQRLKRLLEKKGA